MSKEKIKFIKTSVVEPRALDLKKIGIADKPPYPIFSFKHLQDFSINNTNNHKFLYDFLIR